ncbi:secondary metabolism regulator LAE1 [Colletotrichum spaethianum]|uniref:Secondary metabolism regulator LAE1 n=1 Tax=Colletotrichum spaethianum TaxID=700344 RepID=A0AA37PH28_9PEZI|nr:secondary metabolism regulator LAE1 [Colletotrichum spaethianum]GKT52087.1 secondary metabolism regulator LAE1 [Colletotrichum spaethianum]
MSETNTNPKINPPVPSSNAATALASIEVDDGDLTEDASTMDDRISSYSASLTSSIIDYPEEYGRRYHAYRAGSYQFPNDEREIDRLDFNHTLIARTTGQLFLAPIEKDKTHRILDVGTGTGIWAIEIGDGFPNAEVVGIDLSAIQPSFVPPNVKFEIDDAESSWVGNAKYDFIFSRYLALSIANWPRLVGNIYTNLNNNGWAEFQDYSLTLDSDDGTLTDDHQTMKWQKWGNEIAEKIGRDFNPGPKLRNWVAEAGFRNIVHKHYKIPVGPWAKGAHYKEIGMLNLMQLLDGLEAFTLRPFCGVLGWTTEEAQVLRANVRKEIKSGAFHAHLNYHVVYGQKVESEGEKEGE